jgi:hypothetical protein
VFWKNSFGLALYGLGELLDREKPVLCAQVGGAGVHEPKQLTT